MLVNKNINKNEKEVKEAMENQKIRAEAKSHGVKLWQIAEGYGVADSSFSRKLRRELPEEEQQHIIEIIAKIAEEDRA